MSLSIPQLHASLKSCLAMDRQRLARRLRGVEKVPEAKRQPILETIALEIAAAQLRADERAGRVPKLSIDPICRSARRRMILPPPLPPIRW